MLKRLLALALVAVLAFMMTACGGSGGEGSEGSSDTEVKDTIIIAQGADPTSLDPYGTTDSPAGRVANTIFETLVELDDDGVASPCLAESWEIVDDLTYVFTLRQGVTFHNGEEFTADDVHFSFSKIAESPHASSIRATIDFENSKVIDEYTYEMKLSEPFAPILNHLSHTVMSIVNEEAYTEAGDDVGTMPVGTGPYKFVSWATGDRVDLVANEDYWGTVPTVTNLVFRNIPEASSRAIEVETGGVDITFDPQVSEIERLRENPELQVFSRAASQVNFLCFNTTIAPFDIVEVRQAINMAINKEAIHAVVYHGEGKIATAPMSDVVWAYNDELSEPAYDPETAKELLADAGFADGLELTITCDQNQTNLDMAEMVQAQLGEIGVTVSIETLERGAFIDKVIAGELEMFGLGWSSDTGDPDYALYASFHSSMHGAGGNMSFYTNERVDELLEIGRTSTDAAEREAAYLEAQEIVWEEVPAIFTQSPEDVIVYSNEVQNFAVAFNGQIKVNELSF